MLPQCILPRESACLILTRANLFSAVGLVLCLCLLVIATSLEAQARGRKANKRKPVQFAGKVIAVSDGDTIKVLRDKVPQTVRLTFVDCPEKRQAFGSAAREYTAALCFNRTVQVRELGKDRYNRSLGEVVLPDKRVLNYELVRSGYAWWYEQFAPKAVNYQMAQALARQKRLGLWRENSPTPPWQFRKLAGRNQKLASLDGGANISRRSLVAATIQKGDD